MRKWKNDASCKSTCNTTKLFTVMRVFNNGRAPAALSTYNNLEEADHSAKLQMKYLEKEYDYFIAEWSLEKANIVTVEDRRLKLVK